MPIAAAPPAWTSVTARAGGGRLPATAGHLVYAIGDVHGCYALLADLLARIAADAERCAAGRRPVLILCGDYIDRGPQSAEVLEALRWLGQSDQVEFHALRGNHEQACLDFIARPEEGDGWLRYGGIATLRSYGVAPPRDAGALPHVRDALLARMPAAHLRLLEELPLIVEVGDYVFVHAGIRPGRALEEQARDDLLWIREEFLDAPGDGRRVIVHGHSWEEDRPQVRRDRIGIDTGAYETGVLTALRLDGTSVAYTQAGR